MDKIETPELRLLYFDPTETYLTPHLERSFYNSLRFQERIFGWWPWERVTILLKDFSDYGNAAARSSPNDANIIDIAPLSRAFETFTSAERIYTYMNHELVHVATMDVWNKTDMAWRDFFQGKPMPLQDHPESILYNYLATPRVNVPRWFLEGSAVFMETWMGGGIGRAQGAYDEMVFRAMVRDDAYFFQPLGLESEANDVDFQGGVNSYLYGTRFFSYVALKNSPQKVVEWLKRGKGSKRYYAAQFEKVFGKSLNAAWRDWIAFEHEFQRANIAAVQKFPMTQTRRLTKDALGSVSRAFVMPDAQHLVGAFRYPGVVAFIGEMSLRDGKVRRLAEIKGPMLYRVTSLAYDPHTDKAWYTTDNYAYRDLVELDLASGKTKLRLKDARIGELVFDGADRSLWGIRHLNGLTTLVRIPYPYKAWNQIHTWPYGETPADMDISADGALLSMSVDHIDGDQSLDVLPISDLLTGKTGETRHFRLGGATLEGFVFSPDGRYLFGSSYYTGVSNIYRIGLASGDIEAVSNALTGFFRPIPQSDGSLIAFEYTGQGFVPGVIDPTPLKDLSAIKFLGTEVINAHPILKDWGVGSPTKVPLDTIVASRGKYRPLREIKLGSEYPIVEGYKDSVAFGWHFNFEDPMQFSRIQLTLSYSPDSALRVAERWHALLDYHGINWHARYSHNGADFYDLFGPTKRSRKGDAFQAGYERALVYDLPRQLQFSADFAYYTGLDTLPGAQNVQSGAKNLLSGETKLHFTDTRKSLGAVDDEKGVRFDAAASGDYAKHKAYPKLRAGFDYGFALPWKHASVWAHSSAGAGAGPRANVLSTFYFGGFGNNYVDNGEVKRYRLYSSFPGFDIDEISARKFVKSVVEFDFPPIRFRDVGVPSLYLSWARPAVFAGALWTDPGAKLNRTLTDLGAQLDFSFTLAHRLPMMLSFGYAAGFEDGRSKGREGMISLKIL
jgi:hypothetical protein